MVPTITAYALLALFFALEGALRRGRAARSLAAGSSDRGSTLAVGLAFLLAAAALLLAPLLNHWAAGVMGGSWLLPWLGILIMPAGGALRAWSHRALGEFSARTLRTLEGQRLVREGPYRVLRHPGYLGSLLSWAGAGLAASNWLALLVVATVLFAAYCVRIGAEERMLQGAFGEEYEHYRQIGRAHV